MTKFLSWNCIGFKIKLDDIQDIVADHHPLYFAFQETHLRKNDKVIIRDYSSFRKDYHHSERVTCVVALLISNDVPHIPIPLNTNIQVIAVQTHKSVNNSIYNLLAT